MNDVTKDLLEALKKCRNRFAFYVEHHLNKGDSVRAEDNAQFVKLANEAIDRAESALAEPQPDALEQVRGEEREACLRCYSPDDTAADWADKIRARGERKYPAPMRSSELCDDAVGVFKP